MPATADANPSQRTAGIVLLTVALIILLLLDTILVRVIKLRQHAQSRIVTQ